LAARGAIHNVDPVVNEPVAPHSSLKRRYGVPLAVVKIDGSRKEWVSSPEQ
jgi:hypothetical protein